MPHEMSPGKPTTRRYSEAEKERAVRAVRQLRTELGTDHGTVKRVAAQLGIGVESLRSWVRQAEVDAGVRPGVNSEQAERIKALEQENRELRRARERAKLAHTLCPIAKNPFRYFKNPLQPAHRGLQNRCNLNDFGLTHRHRGPHPVGD